MELIIHTTKVLIRTLTYRCLFQNYLYSRNAPIDVKPAGGDFDIFQKIAVKSPTPGQKCEVKYNWNSPLREMICGHRHEQKFKYPYPRDSKTIQIPYPRAKAIDQNPALRPASPPPPAWHW